MHRPAFVHATVTLLVAVLCSTSGHVAAAREQQAAPKVADAKVKEYRAELDRYCVTCHNARLKTGGVVLDSLDVGNAPAGAAVWERVIRKLRTGQMPPPGRPRPDKEHNDALASWLETTIDRDAAKHPNPGRTETIHRLNRAEYRYAVAARQISRVAIGNPALPPTAETFRLKADLSQDARFDDLPIGTRGGTSIHYQFPLDADYRIQIEPLGGGA